MKSQENRRIFRRLRILLGLWVAGLLVSGLTAFPLEREVDFLSRLLAAPWIQFLVWPGLKGWIAIVQEGIHEGYGAYPFLAYGTDWLVFGHIVIAIAFLGPLKDPVRNIWVLQWGMIACALVPALALIMGPIRGIPFWWQLIDSSFGVVGIVPLWICYRWAKGLEQVPGSEFQVPG